MTGPLDPPAHTLDPAHGRHLLLQMLRVRRLEEKCVELYSAAKIRGFLHVYIGEEAVAAGVMETLAPEDAVVATYREHGHALLRGVPAGAILAEMYGFVGGLLPRPRRVHAPVRRRHPLLRRERDRRRAACRSPSGWPWRTRWPGAPA